LRRSLEIGKRRGNGRSVVDPQCRVEGLDALSVIDASVMPLDCRANTNLRLSISRNA
jgi:choline dehydrogenase-like flavoprotein